MQIVKNNQKIVILLITSITFLIGFILNITSDSSMYQLDLDVVPSLQNKGGQATIILMNIISNIFNPVLCAGYILLILLITSRKLQALSFLIWFIFLSWILCVLKELIHQPRPYWVSDQIQMYEWTCYTQYGSPSGHSMLAIVLLDFLIKFCSEGVNFMNRFKILFYMFAVILQGLVMFSRIYLGMHTFNQVLFGLMIGLYSMMVYYLYVQQALFKYCIKILAQNQKLKTCLLMTLIIVLFMIIQACITFLPNYHVNQNWIQRIQSISRCSTYKYFASFYLKCFQDSGIVIVIPASIISLKLATNKPALLKKFSYGRRTLKYLTYFLITVIFSIIPVIIFLNPFWKKIQSLSANAMALLLWFNNLFGFFFGTLFLIALSPYLIRIVGLDDYKEPGSYVAFKKDSIQISVVKRQTELQSKMSQTIEKTIKLNE